MFINDSESRDEKARKLDQVQDQIAQQQQIIIDTLKASGYRMSELSSTELNELKSSQEKCVNDIATGLGVISSQLNDIKEQIHRLDMAMIAEIQSKTEIDVRSSLRETYQIESIMTAALIIAEHVSTIIVDRCRLFFPLLSFASTNTFD